MSNTSWKVAGVSVPGFSHLADGTPCQDAHAIAVTLNGWLVAVVSDGAGSAARAQDGSRCFADELVVHLTARLSPMGDEVAEFFDESLVREWIETSIETVRVGLQSVADTQAAELKDYHATLVGVVAGQKFGCFFQIGDGAGCAMSSTDPASGVVSQPENGEFANETFFATQDDWRNHLRITQFGSEYDLVTLMSDGVTPFALAKGAQAPFAPFFAPITKFLATRTREDGEKALEGLLNREAIRPISGDDKTFVWAMKSSNHGS